MNKDSCNAYYVLVVRFGYGPFWFRITTFSNKHPLDVLDGERCSRDVKHKCAPFRDRPCSL